MDGEGYLKKGVMGWEGERTWVGSGVLHGMDMEV